MSSVTFLFGVGDEDFPVVLKQVYRGLCVPKLPCPPPDDDDGDELAPQNCWNGLKMIVSSSFGDDCAFALPRLLDLVASFAASPDG